MSEKLTEAAARLVIEAEKVAVERERIALDARRVALEERKHAERTTAEPRPLVAPTGDLSTLVAIAKGDRGETGAAGIPGIDGQHGRDGVDGAAGERGPDGQRGEPGPEGRRGADGARGDVGPAGPVGPQGPKGDTGPAGVPGMVWRGAFSQGVTYAKGDAVELDGSSWIAKGPTSSRPHSSASGWDLLAKKGEEGAPGVGSGLGPVTMPADSIVVTPAGNLAATNVQAALVELQADADDLFDAVAGAHAAVTLAPVGATPAAEGASLTGQVLTLQPASAAHPGVMTAAMVTVLAAQSGTNTGDVSGGGNGLTVGAGQVLTLAAAGAAAAGSVTSGAQEFGGVKTLTGAVLAGVSTIAEALTSLVRAAAASLVLRSSLGAGATDKCVVVGSSDSDGNCNTLAAVLSAGTGIGGTFVERFRVEKGAVATGFLARAPGTLGSFRINNTVGFKMEWDTTYLNLLGGNFKLSSTSCVLDCSAAGDVILGAASKALSLYSTLGSTAVKATKVGTSVAHGSVHADAHILSVLSGINGTETEEAFVTTSNIEHTGTGAGVILKSPDGTRYRLTVANGGTLSIAAA